MRDLFAAFGEKLVQAVRADFIELAKKIEGEKLYAVALVTDSDAGTVYLGLNTEEALLRRLDYYKREVNPEVQVYLPPLRWTPDEWLYSDGQLEQAQMTEASRMLREREDYGAESQSAFYEAATEALGRLDREGLFSAVVARDELTLFLSVNDDDRVYAIEDYSAKLLNPEPVYERFAKRYEAIEEQMDEDQ